ncbi:hypothetical protein FRC02_002901 [Tulasnella sp. 418]|nr:hypothetical protein FRC02_002901 [Tulasnella sp. 418]
MGEFQVTSKVNTCLKGLERQKELRSGQVKIQEAQQELREGQIKLDENIKDGQTKIEGTIDRNHAKIEESHSKIEEGTKRAVMRFKMVCWVCGKQLRTRAPEVRSPGSLKHSLLAIDTSKSNQRCSILSTVMPPDPKIFGRREYIERAVELLFLTPGARIAILGPGGMGKTSAALKVIHDSLVVERFGENRCWIPCEQATSAPLFVELVAKSLNLPLSSSSDRLAEIIAFLKSSKVLYILLFDNLEAPWDIEGQQSNVAGVLTAIGFIPSVSFIITMRGNQHPSSHTIE